MILASPSEPRFIKDALSAVSTYDLENRLGGDYMWSFGEGDEALDVIIQRKTLGPGGDFLPSLYSGLMARELTKMQAVPIRILIVESTPQLRWTSDGLMMQNFGKGGFTREQLWKQLWTLRSGYGLESVDFTLSERDTVSWIKAKMEWFNREKGGDGGVKTRKPKEMNWLRWIMRQVPGLGIKRADEIIRVLKRPLKWDETEATLESVPGIGRELAAKLRRCLDPPIERKEILTDS